MIISVNNQHQFDRMLTFNDKPTIVRIDENSYSFNREEGEQQGSKAKLELTVYSGSYVAGTTYYISINGYQITSVANQSQLSSSNFLVINSVGVAYSRTMAYTIATALSSTPLGAIYDIWVSDETVGTTGQKVIIQAKEIGQKYNITSLSHNFTNGYLTYSSNTGYNADESTLDSSKVILELFADTNQETQSEVNELASVTPTNFITRMEKNFAKGGISFDIAPVLNSITKDNNTTAYAVRASYFKNGSHGKIGTKTGLLAINGYPVNQCDDYKLLNQNDYVLLQHVERGTDKGYTNNTMLYCYPNQEMTISILTPDKGDVLWHAYSLNSAFEVISNNTQGTTPDGSIATIRYTPTDLDNVHYIKMAIADKFNLLFKVIQPVKYNDESTVQTLYWNNEYGGISFMPFTGKRDEQRSSEKITYKPQNFNYYRNTRKQSELVYNNDYLYEVTLTTHYIEKDGIYLLYSLNNAKTVWTKINNTEYAVIIDDMQFNEVQRNIYEVTVKYHYSADNLI